MQARAMPSFRRASISLELREQKTNKAVDVLDHGSKRCSGNCGRFCIGTGERTILSLSFNRIGPVLWSQRFYFESEATSSPLIFPARASGGGEAGRVITVVARSYPRFPLAVSLSTPTSHEREGQEGGRRADDHDWVWLEGPSRWQILSG